MESPAPIGPKTTLPHAEGQPPRKKLKIETGDVAIPMPAPDIYDTQHPFEAIAHEGCAPARSADSSLALTGPSGDPQNSSSNAPLAASKHEACGADSEMLDANNALAAAEEPPPASGPTALLLQPALIAKGKPETSRSRLMELDDKNPVPPPSGLRASEGPEMTPPHSTGVSSHFQPSYAVRAPVATDVRGAVVQATTVALPWQTGTPTDSSKGLRFGIHTFRAGALSPKGSQSGTDQSTSSGATSDIPRDIESANTSIGSPVPTTNLEAKETLLSKADDELSDTSMSLDSTHSPSPDGKERTLHENRHHSEPSSPPYSPRLDAFTHSDQGSAPTSNSTATRLTNGTPDTQTNRVSVDTRSVGRNGSSPKRPSSTILQCSKCSKLLFKVSTGGADGVLCGSCTNRETSQSRQSPPSGSVPVKSHALQGSVTHTSQADFFVNGLNPFSTSASPVLPVSGDSLFLPRTNSYIMNASSARWRQEPNSAPAPGLLQSKRRKPQTVARKVASVPNHTLETSQGNTSRPIMKKANELRTPEKAKQKNSNAAKKPPIIKPDSSDTSTETDLKLRLKESLVANEELQKTLDSQKIALQNYASKTSSLSDNLKEKERYNQELSVDAKKLKDQLSLKEKRIEELQKIEDENKTLHLQLTRALGEVKERVVENKVLEGKLAQALNDKQRALKEKHQALEAMQQAMDKSQQALMEKQKTNLELEEQQKLLILEKERTDNMQKRQESTDRKTSGSPAPGSSQIQASQEVAPADTQKPTVSCADLEYDILNPFEAYPNMEIIVGDIPTTTATKAKPNSSRRFKKLGTRQRLDFALMDRRFIHRQRPGPPAITKKTKPANPSGQAKRKQSNEAGNSRDPLDSSSSDDSDLEIPIEELVGAPAEIMPTIQENGRLCFRDGTLGANGKLPRAKIFHKVGKLDIAGQIR
ncbi:hypothetical protein FGG08_001197 [Glutinoglossum americanum]|uniref:Uncharacterized protein n=1 Tax=Glutinoglossum americanum TaxID=1670608 RepID=A0A9P8L6E0_9PEZI|nr:hypothetical protein FGG08_001197 [Glutinoglossum americanum]